MRRWLLGGAALALLAVLLVPATTDLLVRPRLALLLLIIATVALGMALRSPGTIGVGVFATALVVAVPLLERPVGATEVALAAAALALAVELALRSVEAPPPRATDIAVRLRHGVPLVAAVASPLVAAAAIGVVATGPALPASWAVAGLLAVAGSVTATVVIVLRLGPTGGAT